MKEKRRKRQVENAKKGREEDARFTDTDNCTCIPSMSRTFIHRNVSVTQTVSLPFTPQVIRRFFSLPLLCTFLSLVILLNSYLYPLSVMARLLLLVQMHANLRMNVYQ